jgi:hypothetical protein
MNSTLLRSTLLSLLVSAATVACGADDSTEPAAASDDITGASRADYLPLFSPGILTSTKAQTIPRGHSFAVIGIGTRVTCELARIDTWGASDVQLGAGEKFSFEGKSFRFGRDDRGRPMLTAKMYTYPKTTRVLPFDFICFASRADADSKHPLPLEIQEALNKDWIDLDIKFTPSAADASKDAGADAR